MEQVTAEKIYAQVRGAALATGKEVLRRLPSLQEATLAWLDQYQKGKLVVEVDVKDLSREIGRFSVVGGQLASAAIVAGSVVATGIVLAALMFSGETFREFSLLPALLVIVFLGLLVVALVAAVRLVRSPSRGSGEGPPE
jgi:hypothetical protein